MKLSYTITNKILSMVAGIAGANHEVKGSLLVLVGNNQKIIIGASLHSLM